MLNQLPAAPLNKTGWPWTIESDFADQLLYYGNNIPRISIVTPSFNHGPYIEETIRSILLQNYPNLEYIIIDGGSTDNSLEIIKKYEKWISYWVSEPDSGQSDAINKGFEKCTGKFVNWICSDDLLCLDALNKFILTTKLEENFLYLGDWNLINEKSEIIKIGANLIHNFKMLIDISGYWRNGASISQQSALYPLQMVRQINGLNLYNHYTMDYELWGNLLLGGCKIQNIPVQIGTFRVHSRQKTAMRIQVTLSLVFSSLKLIRKSELTFKTKFKIYFKNIFYLFWFIYHHLRAIIGFKRRFKKLWKKK